MFQQTLHQLMITACLVLRRLFPLNSTFYVTNLCIVYADMCVMLYSDVIEYSQTRLISHWRDCQYYVILNGVDI